jgi:adenylate cyclase
MARASGGATRRVALLLALGVIVVLGGVWYAFAPQFIYVVEFLIYDQHFRIRGPRPANPQVAIVAIDEASLRAVGRWPWSRTLVADLVKRLDAGGAASIAFDVLMAEPERSPERAVIEDVARRLGARLDPAARAELERMRAAADPDGALARAIADAGRVVLPSNFGLGLSAPGPEPPPRQGSPLKSAVASFKNFKARGQTPPLRAQLESFPIPPLLAAATAIGHVTMVPEIDGSTRYEMLLIESRGHYYPSLALEAVRVAAGLDPFSLKVSFGEPMTVQLGEVVIPTDVRARTLIDYTGPNGAIPYVPAFEILQGTGLERIKDKVVFIGATAEGLYDLRVTPVSPIMPGVEKHANMAAAILDGRFIARPAWVELVEGASIVVLPLLLAIVLPTMRPVRSVTFAIGLGGALFAGSHVGFRQGLWIPHVYPALALILTFVGITLYRILTEERQRQYTRRAFQQYVSPEVVARIMQDPEALQFGGELRNLTVLFSDIRDFTTFTEKNDPHLVVQMLREYLTQMTRIVIEEGGTLDKYIGDAVMAEFGAPIAYPDHALRGCRAALRMHEEVERLTAKWTAEGREPFRIGLGVNTGNMVVGNLGSEQLFDYTVIGDEVNLGARLESLNKDYQTARHIIISDATYEAARDSIEVRELGEVKVKGKSRPVVVYELLGLRTTAGSGPG